MDGAAAEAGVSVGTRKADMPLWPGVSLVRAKSSTTSAQVPLVMNILLPLMT